MGILSLVVNWGPVVKHSVSIEAQGGFFKKRVVKHHPCLSLTLQGLVDLLTLWPQWQKSSHSSQDLLYSLCCHPELTVFRVTWYIGQSNTPKWGICCLQTPKSPARYISCVFLGCTKARDNLSILPLSKDSSTYPVPLNFTEVESPWILVWFISHSVICKCPTNKSRVVASSCSLCLISINIYQCNRPVWYLVEGKGDQDLCELNCELGVESQHDPEVRQ